MPPTFKRMPRTGTASPVRSEEEETTMVPKHAPEDRPRAGPHDQRRGEG